MSAQASGRSSAAVVRSVRPASAALIAGAALAGALAGCGGAGTRPDGGAGDGPPPATAELHLIGRFDTGDPDAPRFAWPGSAIATRFDGSDLTIRLDDGGQNQFDIVVDGGAAALLVTTSGAHDYPIASGLAAGPHDAVVTRRTESFFGVTTFLGVSGAPLVATPAPARLIEMIGDSITCGYGVLGPGPTCSFSADTEAETRAWGALAAAELGAAHTAIAYSGKGVVRNYGGDTTDTMPVLYGRTIADEPGAWQFDRYHPDVVVIDLGTNDFSVGDPGTGFADAYLALVEQVRARHPAAWIVVASSPMLSDDYPVGAMQRTIADGYYRQVVTRASAAGDARVSFLDIAEQDPADVLGCDYHPGVVTHQKMAAALVAHVRAVTGW